MKNKKTLAFIIAAISMTVGTIGSISSRAEDALDKTKTSVNDTMSFAEFDQPDEGMDISDTESPEACLLETLSESEFQEMIQNKNIQTYGTKSTVKPDKYEPNNSMRDAYDYKRTTKLSGWIFTEGYTAANCHEEGDEDWFYLPMTWGYKYDVVLKNLYRHDRHIYLWANPHGTWEKYGAPNPQTGMPEKFVYNCDFIGTYYIQIVGGGPETSSFFFAAEKQGTINTALWPSEVE